MTVLKTLLMTSLISVAYDGHLQVGEGKNTAQKHSHRQECQVNEWCITIYVYQMESCL